MFRTPTRGSELSMAFRSPLHPRKRLLWQPSSSYFFQEPILCTRAAMGRKSEMAAADSANSLVTPSALRPRIMAWLRSIRVSGLRTRSPRVTTSIVVGGLHLTRSVPVKTTGLTTDRPLPSRIPRSFRPILSIRLASGLIGLGTTIKRTCLAPMISRAPIEPIPVFCQLNFWCLVPQFAQVRIVFFPQALLHQFPPSQSAVDSRPLAVLRWPLTSRLAGLAIRQAYSV